MFVLELSSFQLETTSSLAPTAAAVLNVTDNHLDRYAGIDEYAAAKARIFRGGGIQVLNRDDPRSLAMRIPGRLVQTFGAGVPGIGGGVGSRRSRREGQRAAGDVACARRRAARSGVGPARSSAGTTRSTRWRRWRSHRPSSRSTAAVLAALARFEGLPHRMQKIADAQGVLFVDDSKGTTVAATRAALAGLGRPAVLIAGGDGKGQDFGRSRRRSTRIAARSC